MGVVAVADREAAEQHVRGWNLEKLADEAVEASPGLLRARVEPMAARQIHEGMDVAAEIGPLSGAQLALDRDEQPDRRAEELEVPLVLREASGLVVAVD